MSDQVDPSRALEVATLAAREAGAVLLSMWGSNVGVTRKGRRDVVSQADLRSECSILEVLRRHFEGHHFHTEESLAELPPPNASGVYEWIVDPLDGTVNFLAGLPQFSVSIALMHRNRTLVGVVYSPLSDQLFTAMREGGAFCNGTRLAVSRVSALADSVIAVMLAPRYGETEVSRALAIMNTLAQNVRGLRLYCSQALELALVASGHLEATLSVTSRGFSAAAGCLLVNEAGGRVTDLQGAEFLAGTSRSLVAATPLLHADLLGKVGAAPGAIKSDPAGPF